MELIDLLLSNDDAVMERWVRCSKIRGRERVPPYVVFGNKTLEGLVRYRPRTVEDAMQVPGVGMAKAQRYLPQFLRLIADRQEKPRR